MTLSEHLEQNSFAYDPEFPPDCAEGKPLSSVRRDHVVEPPRMKRALKSCARLINRRR